ncbi:MAG: YggS family pyridoxal phosphate-dependent enzyme [Proteobacteria bacterium]|nr:YggS family pyridoxal phosphate-dependent enzyme [Pseudomonadota bacterium]
MQNNPAIEPHAKILYPQAQTQAEISGNLAMVKDKISAACLRSGRSPDGVQLLPVSKTIASSRIQMAYAAGCRAMGENKVQEAQEKADSMQHLADLRWIVIGHLQSNKVRQVCRFASEFHALDSLKLAQALEDHLQKEGRAMDVLVQVNTSGEASKYGLQPAATAAFLHGLKDFSALKVRGLMTLAMLSSHSDQVRSCFQTLRSLRDQLQQNTPQLCELSMGMSGDFELAIEEGATIIRVGQAIFGARATSDQYYWPEKTAQERGSVDVCFAPALSQKMASRKACDEGNN